VGRDVVAVVVEEVEEVGEVGEVEEDGEERVVEEEALQLPEEEDRKNRYRHCSRRLSNSTRSEKMHNGQVKSSQGSHMLTFLHPFFRVSLPCSRCTPTNFKLPSTTKQDDEPIVDDDAREFFGSNPQFAKLLSGMKFDDEE
jgi:hypothetical protein